MALYPGDVFHAKHAFARNTKKQSDFEKTHKTFDFCATHTDHGQHTRASDPTQRITAAAAAAVGPATKTPLKHTQTRVHANSSRGEKQRIHRTWGKFQANSEVVDKLQS